MAQQLLYPMEDAADLLGVGRTTVYGLVSRGELATVHIGRRALVTADSLLGYVARLTAQATDAQPAPVA